MNIEKNDNVIFKSHKIGNYLNVGGYDIQIIQNLVKENFFKGKSKEEIKKMLSHSNESQLNMESDEWRIFISQYVGFVKAFLWLRFTGNKVVYSRIIFY